MIDLVELLRGVELFSGLNDAQLERLANISEEVVFNDNDMIFAQGDEGDRLYIIRVGQVEVAIERKQGRRSQVYLGEGQIFGEMALVDYGQRSATIVCTRDNTVLDSIGRNDFLNLCENDKALGYTIMRNLAIDLSFKLRHRNLDPNAD